MVPAAFTIASHASIFMSIVVDSLAHLLLLKTRAHNEE